jgi:hypothetical protein
MAVHICIMRTHGHTSHSILLVVVVVMVVVVMVSIV